MKRRNCRVGINERISVLVGDIFKRVQDKARAKRELSRCEKVRAHIQYEKLAQNRSRRGLARSDAGMNQGSRHYDEQLLRAPSRLGRDVSRRYGAEEGNHGLHGQMLS